MCTRAHKRTHIHPRARATGYHQSPNRWLKGTTPKPIGWSAGIQYDGDLFRADKVLADLGTYYPGATDYEVAGFFWWQARDDVSLNFARFPR